MIVVQAAAARCHFLTKCQGRIFATTLEITLGKRRKSFEGFDMLSDFDAKPLF